VLLDKVRDLPLWPLVAAYLVAAVFVAVLVRNALKHSLDRARPRLDPHLYMVLSAALPRPAGAAFFLFAVSAGLRFFPLPASIETLTKHVLPFLLGTLAVLVVMRIALKSIDAYGESNPGLKSTAGIGKAITWIGGVALIAVIVSDAAGVSLAPALTALGVTSLAVALALQDTLSNFFAGVYLILDKPIRPGDFIRLDSGQQEGYVETIGWRSTQLRTLAPSLIIVPNATLSKAVITNFKAQNPRLIVGTPIEVSLDSDPAQVEAALAEEAKGIVELKGVVKSAAPVVRFAPGFGDRGLAFTIYCTIEPGTDPAFVQQELRKRVIARLRRDGIALAEPNPLVRRAPPPTTG
jgi:small-conductance mechanosensitive channel